LAGDDLSRAVVADLDLQQLQFVAAFLALGGRPSDAVEAARQAGYGEGDKECGRAGAVLLSSPAIIGAIKHEVAQRFSVAAGAALSTILDLCRNGPPSVRLAAAREILDRGIGPVASRGAILHASTSLEDLLDAIDIQDSRRADLSSCHP
jgi:hypothetical protein